MDTATIESYNQNAGQIAQVHADLIPERLYQLVKQFFSQQTSVVDIGCGIGRDSYWLQQQGFSVTGVDASEGMLQQARQRYSSIHFVQDSLPNLASLQNDSYDNIFCSAVIMHLQMEQILDATRNLIRICRDGGVILLSFRGTTANNFRENGKLYTPLDPQQLIDTFALPLLHQEQNVEQGRGHIWHMLIFRK